MPIPELNNNGLLPRGIHDATLEEIAEVFGYGSTRNALMEDLRRYALALIRWPLAQALLIDGSFVTDQAQPNDIDVILVLRGDYDLNQPVSPYEYNLRSTRMVRKAYRLDLFAVRPNSLEYDRFIDLFCEVRGHPELTKGILRVVL